MIRFSELKRGDVVYIIIFDGVRSTYEVAEVVFEGMETDDAYDYSEHALLRNKTTGEVFQIHFEAGLHRTREAAELHAAARILGRIAPWNTVL